MNTYHKNNVHTFSRNLAIMASAGTGKTYQLAMRYILLVMQGADPEDIVAITFTKTAAREIFEKILDILLELILSDRKLSQAKKQGFLPENVNLYDVSMVLQKILTCRKKLHIETNDSFLIQGLQGSPARFGINGEVSILDENDDRPRKDALLQALHSAAFSSVTEEGFRKRQEIYMVLRDNSFGNDQCNLYDEITALLKRFYPLYLAHPDREDWCVKDSLVMEKDLLDRNGVLALIDEMNDLLESDLYEDIFQSKAMEKFNVLMKQALSTCRENLCRADGKVLDSIAAFFLGENTTKSPKLDVFENTAPAFFCQGNSKKEYYVYEDLLSLLRKALKHIIASEYLLINRRTRAVYDLMRFFDESYAARTRRRGLLTFDDVLYLINHMASNDYGMLQVLRERLALRIGHYLLDEFQDTSDAQWGALSDLVSDVIQWNDESRFTSFFMVADVKQSLYQWRNGNPDIFWKICREYAIIPEEKIAECLESGEVCNGVLKGLNCSYRSSTPVLQMVNDIFDPGKTVHFPERLQAQEELFNRKRADLKFTEHISGLDPAVRDHGCSMMLELIRLTGDNNDTLEERGVKVICETIRLLDPFSSRRNKKLSVAVLARSNAVLRSFYETASAYAPELNVTMEGKLFLYDSMGYAFFRQMLIYAMHPGNSVGCSFMQILRAGDWTGSEEAVRERLYPGCKEQSLRTLIRAELEQNQYSGFFAHLRKAFPELDKEEEYMDRLEAALAGLETEQIASVDELLFQLDGYCGDLRSKENTVQLMTVHKSKGLGFDIVFYLDSRRPGNNPNFSGVTDDGSLYFNPPSKLLKYSASASHNARVMEEKELYDCCCNLYVALTRAKCAQFFVCGFDNPDSTAGNLYPSDIVRASLSDVASGAGEDTPAGRFTSLLDKGISKNITTGDAERWVLCTYNRGNPFWYEPEEENVPEKEEEEIEPDYVRECKEAVRKESAFLQKINSLPGECTVLPGKVLRKKPPSMHKLPPSMRFASLQGAELGTKLHEICSHIMWFSSVEEAEAFPEQFQGDPEVFSILQKAFCNRGFAHVFVRKDDSSFCRLLVEQPFLMRDETGNVINGVMDRAVVYYDENSNVISAEVIDYKSDLLEQGESFIERYQEQLEIYRKALCRMTALPPEKVACIILALRKGEVIRF